MYNKYPNYCYSTYNNNLDLSSSDDTIDLAFASTNSFAPFQLSRGYGLIADYTTPLYTENYLPQMKKTYFVNRVQAPKTRVISDVIERQQVLSDKIECSGNGKSLKNISYFFNNFPPTKNVTKIIRYVDRDSSSDSNSESELSEPKEKPRSRKKTHYRK
jgi:hypothetical protein